MLGIFIHWSCVCRIPSLESYGGKVFWISASDVISVVDVTGCSVAEMRTSTDASSSVTAFTVNYSTKYNYPGANILAASQRQFRVRSVCPSVRWSVCPLVTNVHFAKTAYSIEMPFGVVGRVGWSLKVPCMGVQLPTREGAILGEMGRRDNVHGECVSR